MAPAAVLHLAMLLSVGVAHFAGASKSIKDAILCQAEERLSSFERGARTMGEKKEKDGVEVYFSGSSTCGGQETPILFANWSLSGVRPVHVFSAIADVQRQQWTEELKHVKILTDKLPVGARGVMLQYEVGAIMSDRKVHEWETYGRSPDGNEYLFAASTLHNGLLRQLDKSEGGGFFGFNKPVECDSCLSAHHIVATKDGIRATFTTTVNGHPPLGLQPGFVAKFTWGKTADFVNKLKLRAKQLADVDEANLWHPPQRLMTERHGLVKASSDDGSCAKTWSEAATELHSVGSTLGLSALPQDVTSAAPGVGPYFLAALLAAGAMVQASIVMRRWKRAHQDATSLLQIDALSEEEGYCA